MLRSQGRCRSGHVVLYSNPHDLYTRLYWTCTGRYLGWREADVSSPRSLRYALLARWLRRLYTVVLDEFDPVRPASQSHPGYPMCQLT